MAWDFFILLGSWLIGSFIVSYIQNKVKPRKKESYTLEQLNEKISILEQEYIRKRYFLDSIDHLIEQHPRMSLAGMTSLMMVTSFCVYWVIQG